MHLSREKTRRQVHSMAVEVRMSQHEKVDKEKHEIKTTVVRAGQSLMGQGHGNGRGKA
jgi:hypothetical protein